MNIYQKIFFQKTNKILTPGESTTVPLDWIMVHDGSIMMVERYYEEHSFNSVFDAEKIIVVFDHIFPANNALTASLHTKARNFVKRFNIKNFFDGGKGISHQLLLENALVNPGDFLLGGDSHTPTIGARSVLGLGAGATDITYSMLSGKTWFTMGETIKINLVGVPNIGVAAKDVVLYLAKYIPPKQLYDKFIVYEADKPLPLDWRAVLCNMATELGAVTALFEPQTENQELQSDAESDFDNIITIELGNITPLIAKPHSPNHVVSIDAIENLTVDVVFIGTCTGGRLEDLAIVAEVFNKSKQPLKSRLLINPASANIYKQAIQLGIIQQFIDLGAIILPPSCGPCLGQNLGVLGDHEVCVSTANRNYQGRMGNKNASIYLCSPKTAAEIAIRGCLA